MGEYQTIVGESVTDAKNGYLIPGLVIGHSHLYGAFMRGCKFPVINSISFREQLEQLYWKLDGGLSLEDAYYSAKVMAIDHIRCGVTTIFDHHASGTDILGGLSALKKAWTDEIGLRGVYCFETSDRFDVAQAISENAAFDKKATRGMCGSMFGMHASMSLCERTLDQIKEALGKMPIHVHVAESLEDQTECAARYGKRIVERFADKGLINPGSLFAHCIHINEKEAAIMAELGVTAALNITSNLNTGNGLPDASLLERYRVRTILGNDSLGTNFAADIRNTLFAMHLRTQNPWWFNYARLLKMIKDSYAYASQMLGVKLGRFEPGYEADFALVDYIPPTELHEGNIGGHLLDGIFNAYRPKNLWCASQLKMENYQVVFDEATICKESRRVAKKLWDRIGCAYEGHSNQT
jgi:cytosine/adenosine deaminase-related metal-dependent hydrolase